MLMPRSYAVRGNFLSALVVGKDNLSHHRNFTKRGSP